MIIESRELSAVADHSSDTSRHSSLSDDEPQSPPIYHRDVGERPMDIDARSDMFVQKMYGHPAHAFRHPPETPRTTREPNGKAMEWPEADGHANYSDDPAHIQACDTFSRQFWLLMGSVFSCRTYARQIGNTHVIGIVGKCKVGLIIPVLSASLQ
jgi:hypothetical protein